MRGSRKRSRAVEVSKIETPAKPGSILVRKLCRAQIRLELISPGAVRVARHKGERRREHLNFYDPLRTSLRLSNKSSHSNLVILKRHEILNPRSRRNNQLSPDADRRGSMCYTPNPNPTGTAIINTTTDQNTAPLYRNTHATLNSWCSVRTAD